MGVLPVSGSDLWVKRVVAVGARQVRCIVEIADDIPTVWAKDLGEGFLFWIGVL